MKEIYHQKIPWVVVAIIIMSTITCYKFYVDYWSSSSLIDLVMANIFLLVTIVCIKPIIEWRRIEIDDEDIVIYKSFYKPLRISISESLYQVVTHNKDTRSFRFKHGELYAQISPAVYRNAMDLSNRLTDHIKKHNLHIDIVS
jgi:hypothetical protein